jgi:hypothetical protein
MWSSDDSVEEGQRDPGPHHCPFAEGDPQRAAWLRGLADALEAPKDHAKLVQSIRDEIKVADRAR